MLDLKGIGNKMVYVEQLEHKNQYVIVDAENDKITFQSYDSQVCVWDIKEKTLFLYGKVWDYSNTTRKHFALFLSKYCGTEYKSKKDFLKLIQSSDKIKVI